MIQIPLTIGTRHAMKEPQTLAEIDKEMADLAAKRQKILDSTRNEVLSKTKQTVESYKFTAAELGLSVASVVIEKRPRKARAPNGTATTVVKKTPPKYANPKDPTQTWAGGKGRKPKWVEELINAGGDLEETLIKEK